MTLSTRDKVRLRIGDTDPEAPLLNDEELDDFLTEHNDDVYLAAADACDAIAARYAAQFDFSTDNQSFSRSQVVMQYRTLADTLRGLATSEAAGNVGTKRIDGYSQTIDNRTTIASDATGRRRYGLWGHPDRVP